MQSVCSTLFPPLLHSHSLPLLHVGSFPWDAVLPKLILRGLPTGSSSSRTAPTWLRTTGSIPQEQTAPAWVPHRRQFPPDPLLLRGLLSTGCSSGLGPAPTGALHGPQPPPGHIHLLHRGLLHGLQHGDLLHVGPMGCRGTACSTRGLSTGRRGTSAACLEHLLPSFCTDLGVCRAGSHSSLPAAVAQQCFPLP